MLQRRWRVLLKAREEDAVIRYDMPMLICAEQRVYAAQRRKRVFVRLLMLMVLLCYATLMHTHARCRR